MWTLECDGDLLEHKTKWLKPDSSFLIGRPSSSNKEPITERFCAIDRKSISRKHLRILVKSVKAGDGSNLQVKSELVVEDLGSKIGTVVDGTKVEGSTILRGNEHVLRLGHYEHALRIKWHPIVITLASLSKAEKTSADPLSSIRSRVEHLDIKFAHDYVVGQTTHVVAAKRNLPPVLQALVHGNYVTTDEYVDALVAVAEAQNPEDSAPLEVNFVGNLPDARKYVPPPSKEPKPREPELFAPDEARNSVFAGYTFVFCLRTQYENLSPAINGGGGKSLLYEDFQEELTHARDVVLYVKNVAGEKGLGEFEDGSVGKGVVVVRVTSKNNTWATNFINEVDEELNQRSLQMNEFLDPIIMKDASSLRQPLVEEVDLTTTAHPSSQSAVPSQVQPQPRRRSVNLPSSSAPEPPASTEPPPPPPAIQRRSRRPITQSRFKGFDDFDPSQITVSQTIPEADEDESMRNAESQSLEPEQQLMQQTSTSRKRTEPPSEDEGDLIDGLLPATAAMKKRRLNGGDLTTAQSKVAPAAAKTTRKPKKEKEIDVQELARARREAEEAAEQEDKELLANADVDEIASNIVITTMTIKPRAKANLQTSTLDKGPGWDDKWNGRKNFKKFRRKGATDQAPIRSHGVIVPLFAAKNMDFGLGDQHWINSPSASRTKKVSQNQTPETQIVQMDDDEDESQLRRKPSRKKRSQVVEDDEDSIIVLQSTGSTTRVPDTQSQTQQATQTQKGKKRLGGELPREMLPPPKRKGRPVRRDDDDSDEEEDQFKFKLRRKR